MRQRLTSFTMVLFATIVIIGSLGLYEAVSADSSSRPGSTDDPIVTKSYVDTQVADLVRQELEKIGPIGGGGGSSAKIEVVTVKFGQKLIVEDGGELIVRSGKAIAYSTDANGLSDMTDGEDIAPGKPVKANHLILFPRGGRGVEADPTQTRGLIVLVRGAYQLQ